MFYSILVLIARKLFYYYDYHVSKIIGNDVTVDVAIETQYVCHPCEIK